ncbi:PA2928 family protein [Roseisolibacter agri]|uniref:Uncharacterized protein n=1 Tax=Roseisolibacter agri TaxID=2014610 RepID=A0AA37V2L4_9BACT|nr:PA2928 family protein [Roseisolibacter agri]GLC28000.1 hypothetical protein rosag_45130 [Roseisolibacter agri]
MSEYHDRRAGPRRRRRLAGGAIAALALATVGAFVFARAAEHETPPAVRGAPLRVAATDGDALFLLTAHEERHVLSSRGRSRHVRVQHHVDLWRFDPATAAPVFRRRLMTVTGARSAAAFDARLLGAHGGTLWLHTDGLQAVAIADGRPLGNADTIAARSPTLRGAMPTESRFVTLAADGLRITATDARIHRVDPATLVAQPVTAPPAAAASAVTRPGRWIPSSTTAFVTRGLEASDRWLGVLSADEGERFRSRVATVAAALASDRRERTYHDASRLAPPRDDGLAAPTRLRLWSARVDRVSAAPPGWPADLPSRWGTRAAYADIAPLPESPEFLQGGLLHAGATPAAPLLLREPDGVLVLHRDRLGETGRLQLTRVAAPGGRPVWDARLPLSVLQAVLPGHSRQRTLVLVGREYAPADGAPRDPHHTAHEQIVAVDVATGAVRAYDLTVRGAEAPVIGAR